MSHSRGPDAFFTVIIIVLGAFCGWAIGTIFIPDQKLSTAQRIPVKVVNNSNFTAPVVRVKSTDLTMYLSAKEALLLAEELEEAAYELTEAANGSQSQEAVTDGQQEDQVPATVGSDQEDNQQEG